MDISDLFQWIGQVGRSWMQTSYGMHHSRHSRSMSWAQSKGQVETARSPTSEYTKVALQPSLSIFGGWYDVGCWLLAIIYELLCPHYITNISQWYPHHIKPRLRFRPCRHFLNQRWPSLVLPFGNPTWQLKTPPINGGAHEKIIYQSWTFHCHKKYGKYPFFISYSSIFLVLLLEYACFLSMMKFDSHAEVKNFSYPPRTFWGFHPDVL